jgi:hypothetical protein
MGILPDSHGHEGTDTRSNQAGGDDGHRRPPIGARAQPVDRAQNKQRQTEKMHPFSKSVAEVLTDERRDLDSGQQVERHHAQGNRDRMPACREGNQERGQTELDVASMRMAAT